jgi:demethyl-4-deoxygadusol synthase
MSGIQASFTSTDNAFHVEGYEKIDFSLLYVEGAFKIANPEIADSYRHFGRCLMVVDQAVYGLYGRQIREYFQHYEIELNILPVNIKMLT